MEQDLAIKVEDFASSPKSSILGPDYMTMFASLFMSLTTWLMISVGILYMVLGLACMQRWYERMENEHRDKVLEWKREKKMETNFKQQKEKYKQYEADRREGRGEWYDDVPDA
jgi:predicted membrane protein